MDLRQFNKYQTPLTEELIKSLPTEVSDELFELINTVPYIERLIKPDRKYAKDLERDDKGRIIVDLLNPHILENMDYFRPSALHFKEHGCYTKLRPNSSPNSEFGKWLREEVRRSWYGYVRESDGEWVTGDMYFYLNYCPIVQTKIKKGTRKADRVIDFPEVWEGIYLRFHYIDQASHGGIYNNFVGGQHGAEIAKRGCSKSYTMASILAKIFVLGENSESNKNIRGVVTAYQKEYLTKDGTLNKFVEMIDFCAEHTQFPSKRLKSSMQEMTWKMGYIDTEKGINKGTLNEVIGVSSKDDADKLRGKRSSRIFIEEFGNFKNISDIHRILLPSVQEGDLAFGQLMFCGTGGSENSDFSGALEMMYNPKGFNLYALNNIYDKNSQGKSTCIYFFPAYLNRKPHQNEDGVSDVIAAIIELLLDRYKIKYNTSDPIALTRTKAENPCTLQEAVMKRDSTIYPVTDLIDVDNELSLNPRILEGVAVGKLEISNDGKVTYSPDYEGSPIREFPHKDNKLAGAIEFFQMPVMDTNTNRPYSNRYLAGIDPYDDDASTTLSLGSILILDTWTDELVAEYTGRPMFADDFYEICRRLLIFYNAKGNYENNKKGLFSYFSRMNSLYLLTDTLEFLKDKEMVKGELYGNKVKGSPSTEPIKKYGRTCIRGWLLKPKTITTEVDGQIVETTVPQLKFIKNKALLKELVLYNNDGNFDRHDALVMLMLLREDFLRYCGTESPSERNHYKDNNYLGNDTFFEKNYKPKKNKDNDSWI